jgi:hypothetical protein
VASITGPDANPTNAASVDFIVTFSENVTGVDATDFTLTTTGVSGTSITLVSGTNDTYTVSVNTGTGDGTIRLDVLDDDSIIDSALNPLNGGYSGDDTYIVDKADPTVFSITRADDNPTNAASVDFTVSFSESVTGVNTSTPFDDFTVDDPDGTGASVTAVSGSGDTYTVTVATGTGDGSIRLDVLDDDSIVDNNSNPLGGTGVGNGIYISGEAYAIDKTAPTVDSVTLADPDPTSAASVDFSVTFSEIVTGVDTTDFTLFTTGVTSTSVTAVVDSGDQTTYTVTIDTGSGDGTIRLDVLDDDSIEDSVLQPLAGGFTIGEAYTIDKSDPTVTSINRTDFDPSSVASVDFTVTFSEDVTGVDTTDFALATSGLTGTSVTAVGGSGALYTVSVNTGTGDGTIRLDLTDDESITDSVSNPLGGPGSGTGDHVGDEIYTIDKTAPTVATVTRNDPDPTSAASVHFTVTFSEIVTDVDISDFTLTTTGVISGALITDVSGSNDTYIVTVATGTGDGTIRLDVLDDGTILNSALLPLDGGFTAGETYTINDTIPPTVSSIVRVNSDPTNATSVDFTVTFNEGVTGVGTGDFSLNDPDVTGAAVTTVSGSDATYTVTVDTGTGDGTIRLDITDDDTIIDGASNPLGGAGPVNGDFSGGETYAIDKTFPTVASITIDDPNPTNATSVGFSVIFSEAVIGVDETDFILTTDVGGASVSGVADSGDQTTYIVTVDTGSGDGTIRLDLTDNDSITDNASNALGGAGAGNGNYNDDNTYTIDKTSPTVVSITLADPDPTSAASVDFTVTFSESVIGVNTSTPFDFTLDTTGVTGASVTAVSGTGAIYTVTVDTGTGDGTVSVDLVDDDSILDGVSNALGGTGAGNGSYASGETYTVYKTAPAVISITRDDSDPTSAASVDFSVTFSEAVTGVDTGDFSLNAIGLSGTSLTAVVDSGDQITYTVSVSTGTGDGSIGLDLVDNDSIIDSASNPLGGTGAGNGNYSGESYIIDRTDPTVASITRIGPNPSNAASVDFSVTFSEIVTGVDATDFILTTNVSGALVTAVIDSGDQTTYTVTIDTGSGDGSIRLDLTDNDSIADSANNLLGGTGAGNGSYSGGETFTIDKTAPTVVSSTLADPDPSSAASVDFSVTYSEIVTGVDISDFDLSTTGTISGHSVTAVVDSGDQTTYTVTVATGTGDGSIRLDVLDDDSIIDDAANPLGGTGLVNGDFISGEIYTIDKTATTVTSITLTDSSPTNAASVNFTVLFSEAVTGVDATDFTLTTSVVSGALVTAVVDSGDQITYTVTVDTGSGDGTIRLDLTDNDSIIDGASNPLGGTGLVNGDFTSGEIYTIDKTVPTVASITRTDFDPSNALSVDFTVTFSEAVTGVDVSDFTLTPTGVTGALVTAVVDSGDQITYTVTVDTGTGDGTIRLDVTDDDSITDSASNVLGGTGLVNGDYITGETYTIDKTAPTVVSSTLADLNPSSAASVNFSVTFSEIVTGVDATDFTLFTTGVTGALVTAVVDSGDQTTYTVTVDTGTEDGTIRLDLTDDDSITDSASNVLGGAGLVNGDYISGEAYTIDKAVPTVVSITLTDLDPTSAASVNLTLTFSESVTGVDITDFTLTATGVSGASVSAVLDSGDQTTYTITVDTGTGDGTIRLDLTDDDSILDDNSNPLGGSGPVNGDYISGETYNIDKTVPTVASITRTDFDPSNALSVDFTVTFSEVVANVDDTDFTITPIGVTGALVTAVVDSGDQTTYTVSVSTGAGDGTIRLDVTDDDSITDNASNVLGGTGLINGDYISGETYTIDKTAPTVVSVTLADTDPTSAPSVNFTVTFSEIVTGVDIADFTLTPTGVTGTLITAVVDSGDQTIYTVTVDTGSGDGTIRLDVLDDDTILDNALQPLDGGYTSGEFYTIADTTAPTVVSITRINLDPTNAASVDFSVTFSEPVTGVDDTDFTLTTTVLSGASVTAVVDSGDQITYTVSVDTGTGDGTIRLDLTDDDSIIDSVSNPLGGTGLVNGDFTSGEIYAVDKTIPTVASITRTDFDPSNALSVDFTVTFSEVVTGVDVTDFTLTPTGVTGALVTTVLDSGDQTTYTVTVDTGTGDGTIRLDLTDDDSITDSASNALGGTGLVNGDYIIGETYTIDKTAPTVVTVTRSDPDPTNAANVDFSVTFSEIVTGVDTTDLTLTTTGVTGALVTDVVDSGDQTTYTVTVNTGAGDGTIRLDVVDDDTILDSALQPLNGGFITGDIYSIDKTAPTVVSITRTDLDPTNALSVDFTVTFSEAVTGVDTTDFSLNTIGVSGTSISGVVDSGDQTTYTVSVNTGTGHGTIRLDLLDDDTIIDSVLHPLDGGFTGGETYTIDKNVPTVASITLTDTDPTSAASVDFTVTFSEAVSGVGTTDFTLTTTGVSSALVTAVLDSGDQTTYTVSVNTGTGDGTIRLDVTDDDSIIDSAGNALGGTGTGNGDYVSGETYNIDKTAPTVASITLADPNPNSAASVDFTVTFNEIVTGVDTTDFTLTTTGVSGTSVTAVSGSDDIYTVTVDTGSGDGTIRLDLSDDDSIIDSALHPLDGGFTGGEIYTIDKTVPTVISITRTDGDPTNAASVDFTVTFSENVTGVGIGDFTLNTPGVSGAFTSSISGSDNSYTVRVNTGTGDGTIRMDLLDNDSITDVASNPLGGTGLVNGDYNSGESYTIDKTTPTVASITRADPDPTGAASIDFSVSFSEAVNGVGTTDFTLITTGVSGTSVTAVVDSGDQITYTVSVNTGTGDGTIRLDLTDDESITDNASNPLGGSGAGTRSQQRCQRGLHRYVQQSRDRCGYN